MNQFDTDLFLAWLIFQQLGAEIGKGSFAVVFQALNVETGTVVAVKRFELKNILDEAALKDIEVKYYVLFYSYSDLFVLIIFF